MTDLNFDLPQMPETFVGWTFMFRASSTSVWKYEIYRQLTLPSGKKKLFLTCKGKDTNSQYLILRDKIVEAHGMSTGALKGELRKEGNSFIAYLPEKRTLELYNLQNEDLIT